MIHQEEEIKLEATQSEPKPGLLFSRLTQEFSHYHYQFIPEDAMMIFSSKSKGLKFEVHHVSQRSLLARITEGQFQFRIPNSPPGDAEIHLGHEGHWRRTGIHYKVKRGQQVAQQIAEKIITDRQFYDAFLPLDSRRFYLIQDEQGWVVDTTQMGASFVGMLFPPMKRYVPMGNEQVAALEASFLRLQTLLSRTAGMAN